MTRYLNRFGDSGVVAYDLPPDAIMVKFRNSLQVHLYSHTHTGAGHASCMKRLVRAGKGVTTYISQHLHDHYEQ